MPKEYSLNARAAFNAGETTEVPIVLVTITHESLDAPVRLSSDPTERLSIDPLRYGTVSEGLEYDFVLMSAILPDDRPGAVSAVTLAFENVSADMAAIVRAVTTPAEVDLALVMASAPNHAEERYTDLRAMRATYDGQRVVLDISRELTSQEPWPAHRMTQERFPGLYR